MKFPHKIFTVVVSLGILFGGASAYAMHHEDPDEVQAKADLHRLHHAVDPTSLFAATSLVSQRIPVTAHSLQTAIAIVHLPGEPVRLQVTQETVKAVEDLQRLRIPVSVENIMAYSALHQQGHPITAQSIHQYVLKNRGSAHH